MQWKGTINWGNWRYLSQLSFLGLMKLIINAEAHINRKKLDGLPRTIPYYKDKKWENYESSVS